MKCQIRRNMEEDAETLRKPNDLYTQTICTFCGHIGESNPVKKIMEEVLIQNDFLLSGHYFSKVGPMSPAKLKAKIDMQKSSVIH